MKNDLNYSGTDCFAPFPFPTADPREPIPELESIGQALYDARARYMVDTDQGLTDTHNLLKDPACDDTRIVGLRDLHEEMDRAVLAAYGWDDIDVPRYTTPTTDAKREALERFEDEVIDRKTASNKIRIQMGEAATESQAAGSDLRQHLQLKNLSKEGILGEANARRRTLGLKL